MEHLAAMATQLPDGTPDDATDDNRATTRHGQMSRPRTATCPPSDHRRCQLANA
jgi:hypothetical protein